MRRPEREFGLERPRVVYVALRWNDSRAVRHKEERMLNLGTEKGSGVFILTEGVEA